MNNGGRTHFQQVDVPDLNNVKRVFSRAVHVVRQDILTRVFYRYPWVQPSARRRDRKYFAVRLWGVSLELQRI